MARCSTLGVLLGCCLLAGTVSAQPPPIGPGSGYYVPQQIPGDPSAVSAPPAPGMPTFGAAANGPYAPYGPVDGTYAAPGYAPDGTFCPPQVAVDDTTRSPFNFNGWFVRTEYLNWNFSRPGDVLLGSQILGNPDPRIPRPIFDGSGNFLGNAFVPFIDNLRLNGLNGVRGTVGIPLVFGTFEGSVFAFHKGDGVFETTSLVGTSTLVNGQLGDNTNLYNNGFVAGFNSQLWGFEDNIVFDGSSSNAGYFTLKPVGGFRFLNLTEELDQRGQFLPDPTTGFAPITSTIKSHSINSMFFGQAGFRFAFDSQYVSFAITPKFGLGANVTKDEVTTTHFRSNSDPYVATQQRNGHFAQVINIPFTGKIHLGPNISFIGGYEFLWVNGVTRPQNSILYNDNGPLPTPPGVVVHPTFQQFVANGMTLGMEVRY